jgi:hypothetical protein
MALSILRMASEMCFSTMLTLMPILRATAA